ncbi:class I SAM-dependent methyltransferase [Calidithermus roseus]|uniref:dTDP-3-amino-3,4, 6-trideoxy-alpha-D-glucopyranose n=1 Tax=Calidithermus roseus TaxID=1644118 RepID=A0A399EQX7_9DEIN|nr:class I SAM-dependent methyltransferase [Calidithermus roseus]RIH87047.1 dTDP-3-amino-3,4,6-trideoxy-alpha-D-glucopyranose [Calidithermus roseus]
MARNAYGWLYDKIYSFKDYAHEAALIREIIHSRNPGASSLLDVACGTGKHLDYLKAYYQVVGTDLDEGQLEEARKRHPDVAFYQADMRDFDLGQRFDAVTCLFSAIGHTGGVEGLGRAVASMARHLEPGGVLLIEPWLSPEVWQNGRPHAVFVDEPELKVVRMNTSRQEGRQSVLEFHYLLARPQGVEYFTEELRLFLFTHEEYMDAFRQAGLSVEFDPQGLTGRGLYVGLRS